MILVNLADETVKNLNFLSALSVCVLGGLMDNNFFNQGRATE